MASLPWEILKNTLINSGKWSKLFFRPKPNIDTRCTANKKSIANEFCLFFSKIAGVLKEKSIKFKKFIRSTPYKAKTKTKLAFKLIPVTVSEVFVKLKKLKHKKAARPDNLPPGFTKRCCYHNGKAIGTRHQYFRRSRDRIV